MISGRAGGSVPSDGQQRVDSAIGLGDVPQNADLLAGLLDRLDLALC